jgi:6-phosphogluconolactonase/glucosamine-6-phosphate isomerase/deaminase
MKFILTSGWDDGIADLTARLAKELAAGKRVLWLVSGGSNIQPVVQVMDNVPADLTQYLTVLLADERYGDEGHADSNWAQVMKAGFKTADSRLLPVLQKGLDFEATLKHYNQLAEAAFANNDLVVAQLGIGSDGHIAGIMIDSPAAKEQATLVAGYQADDFKRLTLTFPALAKVSAAYVFAFGPAKVLQLLHDKSVNLTEQPAQVLKKLPEAYIYNDQVGRP